MALINYIKEEEVKKTSVAGFEFLEALKGKQVTAAILQEYAETFCKKSSRANGEGTPRESVKLFDKDGNVIGRRCTLSHKWLSAEHFNGDVEKMSVCREASKLRRVYRGKAKEIETAAESILAEARTAESATDKLELFEQYDAELARAKAILNDADYSTIKGFDTVEDLAASLKVEAITVKAKVIEEDGDESEDIA